MVLSSSAWSGEKTGLYEKFSKEGVVKVADINVELEDGVTGADTSQLKNEIVKALDGRKTINFETNVPVTEADINMKFQVKEMLYMDKDPVDMIIGAGAIVMDALKEESYARIQVICEVTDASSGKVLWEDTIKGTITDEDMTEAQSKAMIYEKVAKIFMKECFSKKKG